MTEPIYYEASKCLRCGHQKEGLHYSIIKILGDDLAALRAMFPNGAAGELNFVLFSTSGVHGTYVTLEMIERSLRKYELNPEWSDDEDADSPDDYVYPEVTVLIVHPRVVALRYGCIKIESLEDIEYLKKLRASSWEAAQKVGRADELEAQDA